MRGPIAGDGSDETGFVGAANGAEGCIEQFDELAQAFLAAGNPVERANIAGDTQRQVDAVQSGDEGYYNRARCANVPNIYLYIYIRSAGEDCCLFVFFISCVIFQGTMQRRWSASRRRAKSMLAKKSQGSIGCWKEKYQQRKGRQSDRFLYCAVSLLPNSQIFTRHPMRASTHL